MGICSTCPKCGAETWNYCCPSCDANDMYVMQQKLDESAEEIEKLKKEIELLKQQIAKLESDNGLYHASY